MAPGGSPRRTVIISLRLDPHARAVKDGSLDRGPAPGLSALALRHPAARIAQFCRCRPTIADDRFAHLGSLDELNRYMDELRAERDDTSA